MFAMYNMKLLTEDTLTNEQNSAVLAAFHLLYNIFKY